MDSQRGYRFTGDWRPERIPDMKGFVAAVHDLGMKFMLWYSVPLEGEASETSQSSRGKYLRHWASQGAYVLDPRYPEEPVEAAALQFLNVLFAVPQLSVKLTQYPESHQEMVAFWTRYWKENREVLMRGAFVPTSPGSVYPLLLAHKDGKAIAGVYTDAVVTLPEGEFEAVDLVNAKARGDVVLETRRNLGVVDFVVLDTRGREVNRGTRTLNRGVHLFSVPPSGLISIRMRN